MGEQEKHIDENQKAVCIDWLRGDGPQPGEDILNHVHQCDACKQEILDLAGVLDELDQAGSGKKLGPPLRLVIRWAAALIGVMLVAMLIQFLRPEPKEPVYSNQHQDTVQVDSTRHPEDSLSLPDQSGLESPIRIVQHDTVLYAQNFVPNAGLEMLVNSQFRSGNASHAPGGVRQLKTGTVWPLDFLSGWDGVLKFTLSDNRGKELLELTQGDWKPGIALDYDPGLYYWKVFDQEGILQVGKIKLLSHPD